MGWGDPTRTPSPFTATLTPHSLRYMHPMIIAGTHSSIHLHRTTSHSSPMLVTSTPHHHSHTTLYSYHLITAHLVCHPLMVSCRPTGPPHDALSTYRPPSWCPVDLQAPLMMPCRPTALSPGVLSTVLPHGVQSITHPSSTVLPRHTPTLTLTLIPTLHDMLTPTLTLAQISPS